MTTRESPPPPAATRPAASARRRERRAQAAWQKVQLAWRSAGRHVPALRGDLAWYAGIQLDRVRAHGARLRTRLAFGLLALVAIAIVFAIAAWLLAAGVAGGVGELLGGSAWLGQAATGAGALVALAVVLGGSVWWQGRRRLHRLVRRHARLAELPATPPPQTEAIC